MEGGWRTPPVARFDAPLGCDGRRAIPALALRGKHPRRVPGRHGRSGLEARPENHLHLDVVNRDVSALVDAELAAAAH